MERYVFTMLHRAKDESALAAMPLIASLRRRTGIDCSTAVLARIVRRALPGSDPRTTRLRSAILDVDFVRTVSNAELAARKGISRRHFQRQRAAAVSAIARYAQRFVDAEASSHDDSRFQRELRAFCEASERGLSLEMRSIAKNLVRIADDRAGRRVALASLAEANVHCGRIEEANGLLESLGPGGGTIARAKLALLRGAAGEAYELACHAARTATERERAAAAVLAAQACRDGARSLEPAPKVPPRSWAALSWESERAVHELDSGRIARARTIATAVFSLSERRGFLGVAARAAAALHAVASAGNDRNAAREWASIALARLLRSGNPLTAVGLFRERVEIRGADDPSLAAVYERLCTIIPQMLADSSAQRGAVCELVAAVLERQVDGSDGGRLGACIAGVIRADSAFTHYVQSCFEQIHEAFSLVAAATQRLRWDAAVHLARESLGPVARLRPSHPRAIPIALPRGTQSQIPSLEHLRNDDGAGGGKEPKPDLAGLRVRIVSLRSRAGGALSRRDDYSVAGASRAVADFTDSR
ncbi:MAG TPA: hypothetical protein VHS56_13535 [Candidatus Cybelea sp.]|nr:hypothetical protein [Candidatus Cybelea sp.]